MCEGRNGLAMGSGGCLLAARARSHPGTGLKPGGGEVLQAAGSCGARGHGEAEPRLGTEAAGAATFSLGFAQPGWGLGARCGRERGKTGRGWPAPWAGEGILGFAVRWGVFIKKKSAPCVAFSFCWVKSQGPLAWHSQSWVRRASCCLLEPSTAQRGEAPAGPIAPSVLGGLHGPRRCGGSNLGAISHRPDRVLGPCSVPGACVLCPGPGACGRLGMFGPFLILLFVSVSILGHGLR